MAGNDRPGLRTGRTRPEHLKLKTPDFPATNVDISTPRTPLGRFFPLKSPEMRESRVFFERFPSRSSVEWSPLKSPLESLPGSPILKRMSSKPALERTPSHFLLDRSLSRCSLYQSSLVNLSGRKVKLSPSRGGGG